MPLLFLSHSHSDSAAAADLSRRLKEWGYEAIFLDFDEKLGIPGGSNWEQEIYRHLRAASAIVALYSPDFFDSRWCFAEIILARELGKHVIGVEIRPSGTIPAEFLDTQIVCLRSEEDYARLRSALERAGLSSERSFHVQSSRPPYPGLVHFDIQDAAVYFGRDTEAKEVCERITALQRFRHGGLLVIAGASGSGKSSLLRAGVLAQLQKEPHRWLALPALRPRHGAGLIAQLRERLGVTDVTARSMRARHTEINRENGHDEAALVIAIDQFEELFSPDLVEGREHLLDLIAETLTVSADTVFVIALRSDYLGVFQTDPVVRELEYELFPLGLMSRSRFAEAIENPASLYGMQFEQSLVEQIITDAASGEALPLLAFVLRELWDARGPSSVITRAMYDALGGIQGAISHVAANAMRAANLSGDERQALRASLLRMVQATAAGQLAKRPALWSTVPENAQRALETLIQARLLITEGQQVEIAHESLLRVWPDLAQWIEDARPFLVWRQRLGTRMSEYAANKDEDYLLHGKLIGEAQTFGVTYATEMTADESEFIESSKASEKRREEARRTSEALGSIHVRMEAWWAAGLSNNLLLSGMFLKEAERLAPNLAEGTGERKFIEVSVRYAVQWQRRTERRRRMQKAVRRVLAAALAVGSIIFIGYQAWIRTAAYDLWQIRHETLYEVTSSSVITSPGWFRLAVALDLSQIAVQNLDRLNLPDRKLALTEMAMETTSADLARQWQERARSEHADPSGPATRPGCEGQTSRAAQDSNVGTMCSALECASRTGDRQAAVTIWNDLRSQSADGVPPPDCLAWMPRDVPSPALPALIRAARSRHPGWVWNANAVINIYAGLAAAGRPGDALAFLRALPTEAWMYESHDFLTDRQLPLEGLRNLVALVRELLNRPDSDIQRSRGEWLAGLIKSIAASGAPDEARALLREFGDKDHVALESIASSFSAKGRYSDALTAAAQLDRFGQSAAAIRVRNEVCEGMVRNHSVDSCLSLMGQSQELADGPLLARVGYALWSAGRRKEGNKMLDRAWALFDRNSFRRGPTGEYVFIPGVPADVAKDLARMGSVRVARIMARDLDYGERANVYLAVVHSCGGWFKALFLFPLQRAKYLDG